jgi:hypothetical protein
MAGSHRLNVPEVILRGTRGSSANCSSREVMETKSGLTKVVIYQNFGFLAIIVLCYLDELLQLPSLIFANHPFDFLYRRSMLEMLLFLAVWLLVSGSTRRLLKRVQHLESFMRLCAWCRRIECEGKWMRLEDFMKQGYDTSTTHGICPECLRRQMDAIERDEPSQESEPALKLNNVVV